MRFMAGMLLAAVLILAGCTVWNEHPAKTWGDATGGEGLERNFWRELKNKNWDGLERHMGGNYLLVTPAQGRMEREAALDHYRQLQVDNFSLGDFASELNGSTLIVTYSVSMSGSFAGKPLPATPVRMVTVWQQQKAGWMALVHTVIGPQQ
jgi:hypothetical protein